MQGKSACCQACVAKCPAKHALGASRLLYAELGWLSWEFASPESPTSIWVSGEALECPCLFLHTREPAVPVQSSSRYPAFLPGQSHQVACPKQHSWGFLTWLPGLISSSVSRPVSRLIRRFGSLPKASDMVRLLWNMKSWEHFAAAAWKLTWSRTAAERDV